MRLHKTGHEIADTVSDLIGELPDGDYNCAYGILRHDLFGGSKVWFEVDKGFFEAGHYDGNYRISFLGTQPVYSPAGPREKCLLDFAPWQVGNKGYTLILPPTEHVCQFFNINLAEWLSNALRQAGPSYRVRYKASTLPLDLNHVGKVITFNSTVGVEALRLGIPVISDPEHSTIGSYCKYIGGIDGYDRTEVFSFLSAHQFKLDEKGKIWGLINHYKSGLAGIVGNQSPQKLPAIPS